VRFTLSRRLLRRAPVRRPVGAADRRAWHRLFAALVAAGVLWTALGPAALAQTRSVTAEQYDVDIAVETDGALAIRERLTLAFTGGPFQHGFQTISLARVEAIRDVRVGEPDRPYTPGTERPYTFATSTRNNTLRIDWWFPPTRDGRRTFEISYRAVGALRIYPEGDQLYWQAIDAERGYPVRAATVRVQLPAAVEPTQLRLAAYPERQPVAIQQEDPRTVRFQTQELRPGTGLTVRVQFPHGLVAAQPPRWQAEADRADWLAQNLRPVLNFLFLLLGLLLPVAGLVGIGLQWAVAGRDPAVKPGAPLVEAPPSDLPAPLVGTLLDERADVQDAVAALIDLAGRGIVRITEVQDATPAGAPRDYLLERVTERETGLREYERLLLLALFGEHQQVRLSEVRDTFAAAVPAIAASLHAEVAREGLFYENPAVVRQRYRYWGLALIAAALIGAIFLGGPLTAYTDLAFLPFLGLLVLGAVVLWAAGRMPRRTRAGALAADRWRAFRRYLAQLAAGQSAAARDVFERYLPYAIAFGLDKRWIERFATVGTPAPAWYSPAPWPPGPIIIAGPGWGGEWGSHGSRRGEAQTGPREPEGGSFPAHEPGGLQGVSDALADLLNRTSEVLAHGGGSDWSGGGAGGFGGGGGGGGSGFD